MGASNAIRAYHGWGRSLKDKPLRLLVWMALHARDEDAEPWYSLGESTHEWLAERALGLTFPAPTGDAFKDGRARDAVLRKVRRHLTPLFDVGAIETKRRAVTGRKGVTAVVYALHLDGPPDSRAFPPFRSLAPPLFAVIATPVIRPPGPDGGGFQRARRSFSDLWATSPAVGRFLTYGASGRRSIFDRP